MEKLGSKHKITSMTNCSILTINTWWFRLIQIPKHIKKSSRKCGKKTCISRLIIACRLARMLDAWSSHSQCTRNQMCNVVIQSKLNVQVNTCPKITSTNWCVPTIPHTQKHPEFCSERTFMISWIRSCRVGLDDSRATVVASLMVITCCRCICLLRMQFNEWTYVTCMKIILIPKSGQWPSGHIWLVKHPEKNNPISRSVKILVEAHSFSPPPFL